jgi:hypothetical protein
MGILLPIALFILSSIILGVASLAFLGPPLCVGVAEIVDARYGPISTIKSCIKI